MPTLPAFLRATMWDAMLPPEVLHLVLSLLPPRHLKTALLVCWSWRQVGEAPGLWKNVNLRVTRENISLMSEVMAARRFLAVKEITVEDVGKVEDEERVEAAKKVGVEMVFRPLYILLPISQHQGVKRVNFLGTDLTLVETGLLARLLTGLDWVEMEEAKMTTRQLEAFLEALDGQTKLRRLSFSKMDLTAVDPALLALAVNRLESAGLKSAKLTNIQSEAIHAHMADEDTKLRTFAAPCDTVPLDVKVRAWNKLEKFIGRIPGPTADALLAQSLVQTKLNRAIITISKLDFDADLVTAARKVIAHLDVSKTAVYHLPSAKCPNNHP